jgi:hypothetical protein
MGDVRRRMLAVLDPSLRILTIRTHIWEKKRNAGHQSYCLVSQGHDRLAP